EGDEFVVNDLDDLLAGVEGAEDFLADGAFGDALDESVGDGEVHVGIEQRAADLLHALADVGFGDAPAAAQLLQPFAQGFLDAFKHGPNPPSYRGPDSAGARRTARARRQGGKP